MSDNTGASSSGTEPSTAEHHSALFANLILQQSNMAMLLMGRTKHPGSDQLVKDLDAARLFIDQLEMLDVKTRGNLSKEESSLLGQTLMALRLEFVEAVEGDGGKKTPAPETQAAAPQTQASEAAQPEESHKKFTKKY